MLRKIICKKDVFELVGLFLILLYPFNSTITHIVYNNNNILCLGSIIFGMILLLVSRNNNQIKRNIIPVIVVTLFALSVTLIRNYYLVEGRNLIVVLFSIYMLLPIVIFIHGDLSNNLIKIIKIFSIEHMIGTYLGIFFKEFYKNIVLTSVCGTRVLCVAAGNYYNGYIPGFSSHFTTNAIYLSIATMMFFSEIIKTKDKKSIVLFILSIIALFTSGKRGHLIITIFSCVLLYIISNIKRSGIIKKTAKLIFIGLGSVFAFIFVSKYIPELTNVITRFESLFEKGDVLNGRGELYSLAFNMWNNHLIIGNGWGSFSYYYQQYIYTIGEVSYLDAHNVYIQVLCETGIVGLSIYVIFVLYNTIQITNITNIDYKNSICNFMFMYNLFFILYSFSGNPLYDAMCYVPYFIVIGELLFIKSQRKEIEK